ncbi:MAG TPA: serine/threonine-protein kinase [Ktedonobacteraceae bacterium]|nr:serine/threonine-protein kinase [Ktedonobacteraceae bacterium]
MGNVKLSSPQSYLGQRFGNYRLIDSLGSGGCADVYLGEHVYLETPGAVKIPHMEQVYRGVEMQGFNYEARIAAQFIHPHIVRVLDFGMQRQVPFLVMDYAPNGTLRQYHPAGSQLVPKVVLQYVRELTAAVEYIHSQGFIHLDIKPENMLLGPHNELWLSDFSIATAAHAIADNDAIVQGTAVYMAPEQIHGNACFQSDQYALAVVVYEWLSGYPPFQGEAYDILHQHFRPVLPSLCASTPLVSPSVENVVFKALAINPQERFESVQAFANALHDAFERRPHMVQQNGPQHVRLQPPPPAKQGEARAKVQRIETIRPRAIPPRPRQKSSKGTNSTWKEIALFYAVDLIAAAALASILVALGSTPLLLALLMAVWLAVFPLVGALIRENTALFFVAISITVASALVALLASSAVAFNVAYISLLLLSLVTAFAASIHQMQ